MRMKVTIWETENGWEWQAHDTRAVLRTFGMGPDDFTLEHSYAKSAQEALAAAEAWWQATGLPWSRRRAAREEERKRQIKQYGSWSHERLRVWEREQGYV